VQIVEVYMPKSKAGDEPEPMAPQPQPEPAPQPAEQQQQVQAEAASGGDTVKVEGGHPSRGAQVILTGEAVTAARGGLAGSIEENTLAKEALEADGTVADGYSPDGSTRTGKPAADIAVTEEAKPSGEVPAEPGSTRVESTNPETEK
jgi:hypothetical protein